MTFLRSSCSYWQVMPTKNLAMNADSHPSPHHHHKKKERKNIKRLSSAQACTQPQFMYITELDNLCTSILPVKYMHNISYFTGQFSLMHELPPYPPPPLGISLVCVKELTAWPCPSTRVDANNIRSEKLNFINMGVFNHTATMYWYI